MFKILWDKETGGIRLTNKVLPDTLGVSPRPVFFEELDLLKLDKLGWSYPHCKEPLLWACNKQYYYRGDFVFEVKGANLYNAPQVLLQPGFDNLSLKPIDVEAMLEQCKDYMFLAESEAIEFIRDIYLQYASARHSIEKVKANQMDFEALAAKAEKTQKRKMAIVKQDCDSFDIMPLETAKEEGKKVYQTTKIDVFLASFSGGKDSQVVLDLCTRAIPPSDFEVIYSDTGYELPSSLALFDEVKAHYRELFPELRFRTARNHESVLNYWDKIGTPSDAHRWCCSVMKTAPLYRMLKIEGTNQQAKVLAFEGVRAEESVKRNTYNRIGKGIKHNGVINARPILLWNTTEVFLYLFKYNLSINSAYRMGKPRVGCLICPFSSEWDDMIVNTVYTQELSPFLTRLEDWAKSRQIPNLQEYIQDHKWKLRASGNSIDSKSNVVFKNASLGTFQATVSNAQKDIITWLPVVGQVVANEKGKTTTGNFKYKEHIYDFTIEYHNNRANYTFIVPNITDVVLIGLLKRICYKSTFCINCEACEVECPTGALSVYPSVLIDSKKCVHCFNCLDFHSKGCIVADSLSMTTSIDSKLSGISGYGTFGLREEWMSEFFVDPDYFWNNNSLGKKQVPSFKAWLKDAEIIDGKSVLTEVGIELSKLYQIMPDVTWEIIWINLCNNSSLIKWFINNVKPNTVFSKEKLLFLYKEQYQEGVTTFEYALQALNNFLMSTPIGSDFNQKVEISKTESQRKPYDYMTEYAVVYSLYKLSERIGVKSFRVSDLYQFDMDKGPYAEFGIGRQNLESVLRTLNSSTNRLLVAELNMGLDHITLRDDITSIDILKQLTV